MSRKHDWASYQKYINAHERVLRTYSKFMDQPKLYQKELPSDRWLILECEGIQFNTHNGNKVRVDIHKDAVIDPSIPNRPRARTFTYRFNCSNQMDALLRYDGPDLEIGPRTPSHHSFHHKHDFTSGREVITRSEDDEWPHVHEFFNEVLMRL